MHRPSGGPLPERASIGIRIAGTIAAGAIGACRVSPACRPADLRSRYRDRARRLVTGGHGPAGGHSVWYSWRAPKSGTATFDTLPGQPVSSKITCKVAARTTYTIAIDGRAGSQGNGAQGNSVLRYSVS